MASVWARSVHDVLPSLITQLQQQIFDRQGFRCSHERLGASRDELERYHFAVMAPQPGVPDWKRKRLGVYLRSCRRPPLGDRGRSARRVADALT